ncbi:MAG TPA: glycosyltransferase family 4 protein, partial [Planctomycetaceae bacterium]|nr:glycosyltransferase family 4 protein [Planctomycetaceae bacterium]
WLDTFSDDLAEQRRQRPPARLRVLFVGGDFERKGGPLVLKVWREAGWHRMADLDLVTDAPLSLDDLPPGVILHRGVRAYSPEWVGFFARADVFVLPTRHEAMGQVFKEAAAAGLPCVATRINAIPEVVDDGATGTLVPVDDACALAAAVNQLLKSADLRFQYGQAARRLVEEQCDPAKYAERLSELMESALQGTSPKSRTSAAVPNRAVNTPADPVRVLCLNSGFLGHKSVARLIDEILSDDPRIDDAHLDLDANLSLTDRAVRRVMCARLFGHSGFLGSNLDFARYRGELHSGVLAARRLNAWERRHGPADVLHFHTQATAYCSLWRMQRTPSVVSIDCTQRLASLEAPSSLERRTFWPNLVRDGAVFRRAFAITCTSEWAASDLRDCYPDAAHKVHVMPYPVRLDLFDRSWAEVRRVRWQSEPNRKVQVFFMGGDFPRKGGEELLAAWQRAGLADRAELILVTGWSFADRALPAGVTQVSGITAYTPAWRELWESADLFVMPTRGEAFGMVYQEAAAAGLPAIGTRLNAVPEIVADGATGLLVAPGSVDELATAMTRLVDDVGLRHRFGQAARERAERLYAPQDYTARLVDLLLAAHDSRRTNRN